jgi:hypothetical protein
MKASKAKKLDDLFELHEVRGKRVYVVDDHHKAFAAYDTILVHWRWAGVRVRRLVPRRTFESLDACTRGSVAPHDDSSSKS